MKELKVGERVVLEITETEEETCYGCCFFGNSACEVWRKYPCGPPSPRLDAPSGNIPSDKQKCQPNAKHEFTIKGIKIMAASKKDAIKKYNHRKK